MADGVRAIHLKPGNPKAHVCHIRALEAAGFTKRSKAAIEKFKRVFPEEKELETIINPCM